MGRMADLGEFYSKENILKMREELIEQFKTLQKSVKTINRVWDDVDQETFDMLSDDYPFDDGFEEISMKINDWAQTQIEQLKK